MTEPATKSGALGPDHGYGPDIDHVLLSEEQIRAKIVELADQIATDYAGKEVLLVGVLKGAVLFMSDFARALQLPTQMEFMAVSSYGNSTNSSGEPILKHGCRGDFSSFVPGAICTCWPEVPMSNQARSWTRCAGTGRGVRPRVSL